MHLHVDRQCPREPVGDVFPTWIEDPSRGRAWTEKEEENAMWEDSHDRLKTPHRFTRMLLQSVNNCVQGCLLGLECTIIV